MIIAPNEDLRRTWLFPLLPNCGGARNLLFVPLDTGKLLFELSELGNVILEVAVEQFLVVLSSWLLGDPIGILGALGGPRT